MLLKPYHEIAKYDLCGYVGQGKFRLDEWTFLMNNQLKQILLTHPYQKFEHTPEWETVEKCMADLIENGDIELSTPVEYVVVYICKRLHECSGKHA